MSDFANEKKPGGVVRFHLNCIAHGDLGEQETELAAEEAAATHIRTKHVDLQKNVSPTAEVLIHQAKHIRSTDL